METKTKSTNSIVDKVIGLLHDTKAEIEQFWKEVGHERGEVALKYLELKEEMKTALQEMRELIQLNKAITRESVNSLNRKLIALEQQLLAAGENTSCDLVGHLAKIKTIMTGIVDDLCEEGYNETFEKIHDQMYRFKIKLDILKLKLELGKMNMKDILNDAHHSLDKKIEILKDFSSESEETLRKRWKDFSHGVNDAYSVLNKTFTSR